MYRELIDAAKKDSIMNAHAHHTHYGYSNHGKVRAHDPKMGNPERLPSKIRAYFPAPNSARNRAADCGNSVPSFFPVLPAP